VNLAQLREIRFLIFANAHLDWAAL